MGNVEKLREGREEKLLAKIVINAVVTTEITFILSIIKIFMGDIKQERKHISLGKK